MLHRALDDTEFYLFDGVSECLEKARWACEVQPGPKGFNACDHFQGRQECQGEKWLGIRVRTWNDVLRVASSGWQHGVRVVESMLAELDGDDLPEPVSRKRRREYRDDAGDDICVDRAMRGQEMWEARHRRSVSAPIVVTIVADVSTMWAVTPQDMLWRGAAAVALCYLIERSGFRVDFWSCCRMTEAYENDLHYVNATHVKRPGDAVDLPAMAVGVSAWFYRLGMFGCENLSNRSVCCTHVGRPDDIRPILGEFISDPNPFVLEDCWTHEAAVEAIRAALTSLKLRSEGVLQPA